MTGFSALLILLVDPRLVRIERVLHVSTDFVSRGQSSTELAAGSGRMELWTAIAAEYEKAPLIGHGYFMTSSTGYLDVWGGRIMRDAHNFLLQVVASTGLVGLTIFAVASVAIAAHYRNLWRGDADARMWARISLLLFIWYVGWGLGCTTFMGPLRPDSLAFYLLLGLGLAEAQRVMTSRSAQSQLTETRTAPEQWRMA